MSRDRTQDDQFLKMMGYGARKRRRKSFRHRGFKTNVWARNPEHKPGKSPAMVSDATSIVRDGLDLGAIRKQAARRHRKVVEADLRAQLVDQAGEQAEESWKETYTRKGRKSSRQLSAHRGKIKRARDAAIEASRDAAYSAWDETYANEKVQG